MASSMKSAIEPGSSSSNVSPTSKSIANAQNEELQKETGSKPAQDFFAGGHHVPPMAHNGNGPYTITGQPMYYPPPPPTYPTYSSYPAFMEEPKPVPICRFVTAFIVLIIVILVFFKIIRTIYQPQDPSVSITSANLTAITLFNSSTVMSFSLMLTFLFHNPNERMSISYYNGMDVNVLYGEETITSNRPSFGLDAESDRVIEAGVVDTDSRILASTIKGINEDLINTGEVKFAVDLQGEGTFNRAMGFLTKPFKAHCPSVKIQFVNGTKNGGTLAGPSIICELQKES